MILAGSWATINEALSNDGALVKRCIVCHGSVRAHRQGRNGMRAHFEHFAGHPGCPLGNCYDGWPARHPQAIE